MIERVDVEAVAVFVGADAAEVGAAVRAATDRGERAAAFIGSTEDPGVRAALDEMLGELYGTGTQS